MQNTGRHLFIRSAQETFVEWQGVGAWFPPEGVPFSALLCERRHVSQHLTTRRAPQGPIQARHVPY